MTEIKLTYLAVFLLMSTAVFVIGNLYKSIGEELRRGKKAGKLRLRKRTPLTRLVRLEEKRRGLIEHAQMSGATYWLLTVLGTAGGAVAGKLFFSQTFFAVAVGILGAASPVFFLSIKLMHAGNQRAEKLHASMLILSNSYIVTGDFIQSVRDNLPVLEEPVPFRDFITYVSLIDGNIKTGLRRMEAQVSNPYFSQWVDVLVMAQDDRRMKYVTMSVVDAMADVHQAQRESDTAMYAIWREYFTVLALIFAAPLIFRVLMKDAYTVLVATLPGQALLTLLLAAVVFSLVRAYRLGRPLLM